jgi:hypothetical protein
MSTAPTPQHSRPLFWALLAAVAAVPLAYYAVYTLSGAGKANAYNLGLILATGLPIGGAATFLLGLPVVLLLRRMRQLHAMAVCGSAMLIGAGAMAVVFIREPGADLGLLLTGAGLGLLAGAVFCGVAGIRLTARPS